MFKLNTRRTYQQPVSVTVFDEEGKEQTGRFKATFKVLPHDEARAMSADVALLDAVLVDVSGIEVDGENNEPLTGDALLNALKNDPSASAALVAAYQDSIVKKNRPRS